MILPRGYEYRPGFLPPNRADELLTVLWRELPWSQFEIRLFGRRRLQPRLSAWCSDPGTSYQYSGLRLSPTPWHPLLDSLRGELEAVLGARFNSVLANAYRDGRDSMGWHADDEPELGREPMIASVSLGETRRFLVRKKSGGSPREAQLEHGSLLLMSGHSQSLTVHSVPKTSKPRGLRINLTYRLIGG